MSYCLIARDHPLHGPYHEITGSFLISISYLPGAHDENCGVYRRISRLKPKWATSPGPATR